MSSVIIMLGLFDDDLLDGGLSNDMVIKSEGIDGVPPQGLLMLTLGLAVSINSNLGKGTYAGEICGVMLSLIACS
jgi:hypothetical protein